MKYPRKYTKKRVFANAFQIQILTSLADWNDEETTRLNVFETGLDSSKLCLLLSGPLLRPAKFAVAVTKLLLTTVSTRDSLLFCKWLLFMSHGVEVACSRSEKSAAFGGRILDRNFRLCAW